MNFTGPSCNWFLIVLLDSVFSSHLMGEIKPDAAAFEVVLRALAVTPGQIRFFDDSCSNVEAARALSIPVFQWADSSSCSGA